MRLGLPRKLVVFDWFEIRKNSLIQVEVVFRPFDNFNCKEQMDHPSTDKKEKLKPILEPQLLGKRISAENLCDIEIESNPLLHKGTTYDDNANLLLNNIIEINGK